MVWTFLILETLLLGGFLVNAWQADEQWTWRISVVALWACFMAVVVGFAVVLGGEGELMEIQSVDQERGYIVYDEPDGMLFGWCPDCGEPFGRYTINQGDYQEQGIYCWCTRAT